MTREEVIAHMDMLIAHKDKALKKHHYFNGATIVDEFSDQQPCEEYILKFYHVESLDDYWIGKRLDTMYYAEWNFELQAFVWTYSKYLPWGEHVVAPDTLWKEYTYPSEPKEIPFAKWIKGFLKKHGREQQPCEDCLNRAEVKKNEKDNTEHIGKACRDDM